MIQKKKKTTGKRWPKMTRGLLSIERSLIQHGYTEEKYR